VSELEDPIVINLIFEDTKRNRERVVESGHIERSDLYYGLENLAHNNNIYGMFADVYDAIRYTIPTAVIINENGQRGVMFRGAKSFEGSELALIILDGVIVSDIDHLTPMQITSIRKLTSQEAALYGARAGNGVISITTL
jgi:hypothetical protein